MFERTSVGFSGVKCPAFLEWQFFGEGVHGKCPGDCPPGGVRITVQD